MSDQDVQTGAGDMDVTEVQEIVQEITMSSTDISSHALQEDPQKQDIVLSCLEEVQCAICHERILDPVSTPCGHNYCKLCLDRWLRRSHKCPLDNCPLPKCKYDVNITLQKLVWANVPDHVLQARRDSAYPEEVSIQYCSDCVRVKRGRPISNSIDVGRISGLKSAAQSPPSKHDTWEVVTDLGRGDYDVQVTGGANCYHGKLQLYLDGQKLGRVLDWFSDTTCHPISFTICGVHIEVPGKHTLKGEVVGKACKSNDYWVCLNEIKFLRVGR